MIFLDEFIANKNPDKWIYFQIVVVLISMVVGYFGDSFSIGVIAFSTIITFILFCFETFHKLVTPDLNAIRRHQLQTKTIDDVVSDVVQPITEIEARLVEMHEMLTEMNDKYEEILKQNAELQEDFRKKIEQDNEQ